MREPEKNLAPKTIVTMLWFVLALVSLSMFLSPTTISEASESQWKVRKPLPGGVYFGESEEWYATIAGRISRVKELADSLLGDTDLEEFELYIVDSQDGFDSLVRGEFPHWGAAVAIPHLRRIVLKSPQLKHTNKSLETLAAHEFAHLHIHALSAGGAPRWLDEGLAMYFAEEWSYRDFVNVSLAAARGNMIPLREIEKLNSFSQSRAQIAYAESYLAVSYLFEYYGSEGMRETFAELRNGKSIDSALQLAFGLDEAGFEREAFADIRNNHTLLGILMGSTLFWGALALIVVIGFIRARISRKKRYAQWEEEERYQSTDFDYGDPDNPEKVDDEDRPWE